MHFVLVEVTDAPYSLSSSPDKMEIKIVHHFGDRERSQQRRRAGDDDAKEEDMIRVELLSQMYPDGPDARVELEMAIKRRSTLVEFSFPSTANEMFLRNLWELFPEKVKVSVSIIFTVDGKILDNTGPRGMGISYHNDSFFCCGYEFVNHSVKHALDRTPRPKINLKLSVDVPEKKVSPSKLFPFARMILEKELSSDVIISAGNGAEIKSHRSFLQACSPVFEAMFKNDMMESQTGRVDMTDMSEHGVRAFLRYVYHGDLKEPKRDVGRSFELFIAAHKYNVRRLEKKMLDLLLEWKDEDFSLEFASKVYIFSRNIGTAVQLKAKALNILKTKMEELELLPEYKEMDAVAAMALRKEMEPEP